MEQQSITDGNVDWPALVRHVVRDQVVVELQQDDTTVARISPVKDTVLISSLNSVLASLPSLGDDAETFARELESLRASLPVEPMPGD